MTPSYVSSSFKIIVANVTANRRFKMTIQLTLRTCSMSVTATHCIATCSVLQCVAVSGSALQCVAARCSVLQNAYTTDFANTFQACHAMCCSEWQCVAVSCSALRCVAVCCSVLQCIAVRCSVVQCVAVCCSALQCVAVCCSVL